MKTWETEHGAFESREATPEEAFALKWHHGIIDADVLRAFGCGWPRGSAWRIKKRVLARQLYSFGWPLAMIEDAFDLSEDEAEKLVAPVRDQAIRLLYRMGVATKDICARLEVNPSAVNAATVDIARQVRIGEGSRRKRRKDKGTLRIEPAIVDEIRRRLQEGQPVNRIANELEVHEGTVHRVVV